MTKWKNTNKKRRAKKILSLTMAFLMMLSIISYHAPLVSAEESNKRVSAGEESIPSQSEKVGQPEDIDSNPPIEGIDKSSEKKLPSSSSEHSSAAISEEPQDTDSSVEEKKSELTYENEDLAVKITDEQQSIPSDVSVQAIKIGHSVHQMTEANEMLLKSIRQDLGQNWEIAAISGYDIQLVRADGSLYEPEQEVQLYIKWKTERIENYTEVLTESPVVYHFDTKTSELENMNEAQKVSQIVTDESQQHEELTLRTDSFSPYVMVWKTAAGENTQSTVDITSYITQLAVEKKKGGRYEPISDFEKDILDGDDIKVNINFNIPPNQMTSQNKVAVFSLPTQGVSWTEKEKGYVQGDSADYVGEYVIQNNQVIITYYDDFLNTKEASWIYGSFYVAGQTKLENKDEKTKVVFGEAGYSFTINPVPVAERTDIKVSKGVTVQNDGKAYYTLKVSTVKGTDGTIKIEDALQEKNLSYDRDSFKVVKKNADGNADNSFSWESPVFSQSSGKEKFVYTGLPELKAGESYEITYTVTPKDDFFKDFFGKYINGEKSADNKVKATSGSKISETTQTATFRHKLISKSGTYSYESGKIVWTITVNEAKKDINGWTLTDKLTGPSGTVNLKDIKFTLKDANYQIVQENITLPYTFQNAKNDVYYITYETETKKTSIGEEIVYKNKSFIEDDKGRYEYEAEHEVPIRSDYQTKKALPDTNLMEGGEQYFWETELNIPTIGKKDKLTYTDTAGDYLYFTGETFEPFQIIGIKGGKEEVLPEAYYTLAFYEKAEGQGKKYTLQQLKNDKQLRVKSYTLVFQGVENYQKIKLSYGTYADYSGIKLLESRTFVNTAKFTVKGKTEIDTAEKTYTKKRVLVKQASLNGEKNSYTHDKLTLDYDKIDNTLYYRIFVNLDGSLKGAQQLIDALPEGTSFKDGSFKAKFYGNEYDQYSIHRNGSGVSIDDLVTHEVTADNQLKINLAEGYENAPVVIYYQLSIANHEVWENPRHASVVYKNTVSMGKDLDSQEVEVEREYKYVAKRSEQIDSNKIRYRVIINPAAEDLLKNAETLTLTDKLNTDFDKLKQLYLISGSVKLYYYDASNRENGYKGNEVLPGYYSYIYDTNTQTTTITVPDGKALVLEYQYYFEPIRENIDLTISNKITLEGMEEYSSENQIRVDTSESTAISSKAQITLHKTDSQNFRKKLQGAKFKLYQLKYENSQSTWKEVENAEIVSDENGKILFRPYLNQETEGRNPNVDIIEQSLTTIYKLVETEAPVGYDKESATPFYFVWAPDQTMSIHKIKEAVRVHLNNFQGDIRKELSDVNQVNTFIKGGGEAFITNDYKALEVQKYWTDQNGKEIEPGQDEVLVQLYRQNTVKQGHTVTVKVISEDFWGPNDVWTETVMVADDSSLTISIGPNWTQTYFDIYRNGWWYDGRYKVSGKPLNYQVNRVTEDVTYTFYNDLLSPKIYDAEISFSGYTLPQTKPDKTEAYGEPVSLNAQNDWRHVWNDLSLTDDSGNPYYYSVKEVNVPTGYTVEYQNNGISKGTITVTNIFEKEHAKLPDTGGSGEMPIEYAGVSLILSGLILYRQTRKKKNTQAV